jgi:hypothetical protein
MKLEQMPWPGEAALAQGAHPIVVPSGDLWSSSLVEGLKAWMASPEETPACGSGDLSEALSLIDGAFQAVSAALMSYS